MGVVLLILGVVLWVPLGLDWLENEGWWSLLSLALIFGGAALLNG